MAKGRLWGGEGKTDTRPIKKTRKMLGERRENQRTKIARNVILNADRITPQLCQIRNISMTGVYVELPINILRCDMPVKLVVTVSADKENNARKIVHWPARVARVTEEGAGLELEDLDVDAMGAVLGLLYPN